MTLRPCLTCGEPAEQVRCPEHHKDTRTDREHVAWANNGRWKSLSKRLRRLAPWCEQCGATEVLTVDHLLPVSDYPELNYAIENCRVLCKSCNGRRGNRFTRDDAEGVLDRLREAYRRHPTKAGRECVDAAVRAVLTWGDAPSSRSDRPAGSPEARYTPAATR